ncbi:hypothetical protein K8I85_06500 [bacterium]|nr:hypothetical protein [bacterium]
MNGAGLALGLLLAIGGRPAAAVERAAYAIVDNGAVPRLDELVIERVDADGARVRIEVRADEKRAFAFEVGGDGAWPALGAIDHYAIALGDEPPREFVDVRTGEVMLPRLPREAWLPLPAPGSDPADGWFDDGTFLGRALRRKPGTPSAMTWTEPSRVAMDADRLIANSRDFRDDGSGRRGGDWTWTPLRARDYDRMLDAGFNLFRIQARDFPQLVREPVFLVASDGVASQPGLPFLPTYLGAVMYADEPAVRVRRDGDLGRAQSLADAAALLVTATRNMIGNDERYGRGFLRTKLAAQRVDWGAVVPERYPVWDAIGSSIWYELEAGAGGWCFEARLDPASFARDVERGTGVPFPATVEACTALHVAVFRGAARHFDAPWGVAVYGQTDSATADALFPIAYEAGASYFWFWTSDGDHHVPFARQLVLAERFTTYANAHPRDGGARARTRGAADIALVLPYGYTFDDETFRGGGIWGARQLRFGQRGEAGVPYRTVLAAAVREAVALVERGESWDVLFLRDDEAAAGYREVRRVLPNGDVREESP